MVPFSIGGNPLRPQEGGLELLNYGHMTELEIRKCRFGSTNYKPCDPGQMI